MPQSKQKIPLITIILPSLIENIKSAIPPKQDIKDSKLLASKNGAANVAISSISNKIVMTDAITPKRATFIKVIDRFKMTDFLSVI